ncbi:MAG: cadherin-like beta sandwich domain-containing protein [Bacilli bacterium]|nr:cadherin-like beta sandwich domain-containing protein [Bacilli bacterium]
MKRIKYLLITLILFTFTCMTRINAFSINASNSVYVNSNVAVTIDAKGLIGKFNITSSDESILAGSDSKWLEDETITMYFTAKSTGTATITITAADVSDAEGNEYTSSRSTTINVVKKTSTPSINVNPVYSKNNYLKGLSIDGYTLTPEFNKETLEYTVELEPGTELVNIIASLEDTSASLKGTGEVNVSEGINTLEVVVTAENGNERTYKITASVEEKDPIEVNLNNKNYRVVKKKELIELKEGYKETTVKINDFEIPAIYNEVTKVTLVGLKDEEGNVKLFSYDTKTGIYSEYKEFNFDLMNLYIHDTKDNKYKKATIKINDVEVTAYKLEGIDDYYLVYGTNTSTGYEGYYLYDTKENSIQRYDTTLLDKVTEEKDKYLTMVIVLSCVCFLTMLFLLIEVNKYNKKASN